MASGAAGGFPLTTGGGDSGEDTGDDASEDPGVDRAALAEQRQILEEAYRKLIAEFRDSLEAREDVDNANLETEKAGLQGLIDAYHKRLQALKTQVERARGSDTAEQQGD
jgi:hypothetical protein